MPLNDDGDIVKGLGFVTLYAAYLEESIDECVSVLAKVDSAAPKNLQRWAISGKLEYCEEQMEPLAKGNSEIQKLIDACGYARELFESRNDVVHGRIYGGLGEKPDIRKSGRTGVPDRDITSAELYDLANRLFELSSHFTHGGWFTIPRALNKSSGQAKGSS